MIGEELKEHFDLVLHHGLSRPPCKAGMRLRSERDLAALFRIDRMKIRESLDRFVRKGVLVRRRGSGTFVRTVPSPPDVGRDKVPVNSVGLADMLFAGVSSASDRPMPLQPTKAQRRLHLGVWSNFANSVHGYGSQASLAGHIHRAQELGHRVTLHSVTARRGVPLSLPELARQIRDNPCDGYIVPEKWADLFNEASGDVRVPIVYVAGTGIGRHQPLVTLNVPEAAERAVHLFAEAGYERIGLIIPASADDPSGFDPRVYEAYDRAMARFDLTYRAVEASQCSVIAGMAAGQRMLDRGDRPDAVYVADDHITPGLAEALSAGGVILGRDVGVITLSNRGLPLPESYDWSRLEFDPELLGQMAVDMLLFLIETAGVQASNVMLCARWIPGETHRKPREQTALQAGMTIEEQEETRFAKEETEKNASTIFTGTR